MPKYSKTKRVIKKTIIASKTAYLQFSFCG